MRVVFPDAGPGRMLAEFRSARKHRLTNDPFLSTCCGTHFRFHLFETKITAVISFVLRAAIVEELFVLIFPIFLVWFPVFFYLFCSLKKEE